jgi:hypothetical protein
MNAPSWESVRSQHRADPATSHGIRAAPRDRRSSRAGRRRHRAVMAVQVGGKVGAPNLTFGGRTLRPMVVPVGRQDSYATAGRVDRDDGREGSSH